MAGLEEVKVDCRGGEGEKLEHTNRGGPSASTRESARRKRSSRHRNSDSGERGDSGWTRSLGQDSGGEDKGTEMRGQRERGADGQNQDWTSNQEHLRARFYEHYRKEADEYDRQFMEKRGEDLSTTLIFAGLFSAVASAFIIQVQPQLQQDPNGETAALLRVLIYKMDNTTFGGAVPTIPQWSGPPRAIVQVQAILYASLAVSLLSAFLAMLGKRWLNKYGSVDMRGTAIERSQNRQRKLDGIAAWYFDHVMGSLPLMLQVALLLLGCALSLYLWGINTTIASVVLGVTSFGVLFYVFIVIAGAASVSCPYQTPGAYILRHILCYTLPCIPRGLCYVFRSLYGSVKESACYSLFVDSWDECGCVWVIVAFVPTFLIALAVDTYRLGRAMVSQLATFARGAHGWMLTGPFASNRGSGVPDLHCISWILQKSLDKGVLQSTLEYLATMAALAECDISEAREGELASAFLRPGFEKGAHVVYFHDPERPAQEVVRHDMGYRSVIPQIQPELVDEHDDITSTAVGEATNEELAEEVKRHEAGSKKAQEEMAQVFREKDEETMRLQKEARMREEHARRVREERERMALQHRQEMERAELGARRLEERVRMERQRAEVEHQRQMALLNGHLAAAATAAEAERAAMQQRIQTLETHSRRHREGDCVIM